ncbi:TadE family protein [Occultella aeris]|uniref:TadE-like protein n=1 Tax=Occultella aeris TaxID=2761496 RepID=A0A7M4DJU0_9MICO|nr:TadE family protein [Occultella aeris]VZO37325.1 TadE-like protein [Occultella aeris]
MTLEAVIVLPAVLLLIFVAIQAGLWFHAREVAMHAASAGSTAASAENATNTDGATAAQGFVDQVGALGDVSITIDSAAETVTVTVSGQAPSIVPGMPLPTITQSSTAAIERWTP